MTSEPLGPRNEPTAAVPDAGEAAAAVAMPPFTGQLAASADYYNLEFLDDGFPGRRGPGGVRPHPIYGAYVLKDYTDQYTQRRQEDLLPALRRVGHASVARMREHHGSLVFWYETDVDGPARLDERHYSALTQGYYALYLHRAGVMTGDSALVDSAQKVFRSLLVPAADGGVLFEGVRGPVLAEVPQSPNSYILNGWQSTLASVAMYARDSGSAEAAELVRTSADEMARLLPLYDAPGQLNSRYALTGFVYLRLVFAAREEALRLNGGEVHIPHEGRFDVPVGSRGRWHNYLFEKDLAPTDTGWQPLNRVVRMNTVLSRISYPEPNEVVLDITAERPGSFELQVHKGRYDPLTSAQTDCRWEPVRSYDVAPGRFRQVLEIPWEAIDLVGYPTSFMKKINGKQTNVYHPIHVQRLRELWRETGLDPLREWADRWDGYVDRWVGMDVYRGLYVRTPGQRQKVKHLGD